VIPPTIRPARGTDRAFALDLVARRERARRQNLVLHVVVCVGLLVPLAVSCGVVACVTFVGLMAVVIIGGTNVVQYLTLLGERRRRRRGNVPQWSARLPWPYLRAARVPVRRDPRSPFVEVVGRLQLHDDAWRWVGRAARGRVAPVVTLSRELPLTVRRIWGFWSTGYVLIDDGDGRVFCVWIRHVADFAKWLRANDLVVV